METKKMSKEEIEKLPYKDLQKLCGKYKVLFMAQPREKLIKLILKAANIPDSPSTVADKKAVTTPIPKTKTSSPIKKVEKKKSSAKKTQSISDKKFIENAIKVAHQKPNDKKKSSAKKAQSKSDRIRSLSDRSKTVLEISKLMPDTHYSFIFSVVKKHKAIRKS